MPGILYLVATPIGNLGDVSARAESVLREVDFIAAEDTRVTMKLLARFNIKKPLVSYYEHNRKESGEKIVSRIDAGESCALVTDAGTPAISDPGEDLVKQCAGLGILVIAIPGPCAAVTALSVSGLPTGRFTFEGFLSTSRKSRFEHLEELKMEKRTMVFYEAPHKLQKTLSDLLNTLGDREISISRELTKVYEETLRGTLSEALEHFEKNPPRGEFVLVISGFKGTFETEKSIEDAVIAVKGKIEGGASVKDAVKSVSEEMGVSKNALYNAVIEDREYKTVNAD